MLGIHDYGVFIVSCILLNLAPGQDTLYILGRSITGGRGIGVASALGICTGSVVHTLAATAGLSLLLAASPPAFVAVKLCGAAYLVYLGAKLLFTRAADLTGPVTVPAPGGAWRAYGQGILTNVLNPKVALFFLAFLPQFILPGSAHKSLAFLALGATFITTGTLWCLALALLGARLRAFFVRNPSVRVMIDRITGGLFMLLGARLALSR